ncbi:MAG: hypothetical protein V1750_04840 [Acidobacteriota bacterium]
MSWAETVELMLSELRAGTPRAQSYWAQQLAFGPVVVHALLLSLRERLPLACDREAIAATTDVVSAVQPGAL